LIFPDLAIGYTFSEYKPKTAFLDSITSVIENQLRRG